MTQRFEWAHASGGFELIVPDELDEVAPDGNDDREWGLAFTTGSNGCMVYGSLADLHGLGVSIVAQTGGALAARADAPHLSPGEWAGVMDVLRNRAATMRQYARIADKAREDGLSPMPDERELADDYERIAGVIRRHLGSAGS